MSKSEPMLNDTEIKALICIKYFTYINSFVTQTVL
jgi:hypothetical protein